MQFFKSLIVVAACGISVCLPNIGNAAAATAAATTTKHADVCKRLSARLPGISTATCQKSALVPTGSSSRLGFPILMRQIPARTGADKEKAIRVLLIGGIHGDELTASAIVFQWLQWMQGPLAQSFNWEVAPVVNPDGLLASKPSRVNERGVDLNRNFPTPDWHKEAPAYWTKATRKDPRRFPGTAPLSEPESRWVHDEIERFKPHVVISVHAPFGVLDFDGPVPPPQRFGRLIFNGVGVYPGSLGNYSGRHKNVPVITIELPNARTMPTEPEMRKIWQDMLTWINRNVPKQKEAMVARGASSQRTVEKSGSKPR